MSERLEGPSGLQVLLPCEEGRPHLHVGTVELLRLQVSSGSEQQGGLKGEPLDVGKARVVQHAATEVDGQAMLWQSLQGLQQGRLHGQLQHGHAVESRDASKPCRGGHLELFRLDIKILFLRSFKSTFKDF